MVNVALVAPGRSTPPRDHWYRKGTERSVASALSHTRYDRVVEALGGHGEYVEKARDIRPALERAIASGKPALVNIKLGRSDFRKDSVSV